MKLFKILKDGGKESKVTGFFLCEFKKYFSVVLLHFENGSREAYHTHAFNSRSWILKGQLQENMIDGALHIYNPSWSPVDTGRGDFHKVVSKGDTYVLSFRGPWLDSWMEYLPKTNEAVGLTHGRKETFRVPMS